MLVRISAGCEFRREDAFAAHYIAICVIGSSAYVYLKDVGRRIKLKAGGVLFFRPEFEYKVEWDTADTSTGYKCILTAYTCARMAAIAGME